jgi:hypothetical protein
MANKKLLNNEKVFDSVFWSTSNALKEFLPIFVNEAFKENYSENTRVSFKPGKVVVEKNDGSLKREEMDALFNLYDDSGETVHSGDYHVECETWARNNIIIRIAKYSVGYGFENMVMTDEGVIVNLPKSCVIMLRAESVKKGSFKVVFEADKEKLNINVPIIRITDYSLDDIFQKRLLILLPFYAFVFSDKEYSEMSNDSGKLERFKALLNEIHVRLEDLLDKGVINSKQIIDLTEYLYQVFGQLTSKFDNIRKEVDDMRKVKLIRTEYDIMCDELDVLKKEKEHLIVENDDLKEEIEDLKKKLALLEAI